MFLSETVVTRTTHMKPNAEQFFVFCENIIPGRSGENTSAACYVTKENKLYFASQNAPFFASGYGGESLLDLVLERWAEQGFDPLPDGASDIRKQVASSRKEWTGYRADMVFANALRSMTGGLDATNTVEKYATLVKRVGPVFVAADAPVCALCAAFMDAVGIMHPKRVDTITNNWWDPLTDNVHSVQKNPDDRPARLDDYRGRIRGRKP